MEFYSDIKYLINFKLFIIDLLIILNKKEKINLSFKPKTLFILHEIKNRKVSKFIFEN